MRPRGQLATVLAGLAAGVGLSGCAGHGSVAAAGYRANVAQTAERISLAIASARMGVQLDLDGRMALAVTDQTVSHAAASADSAASALAGREPAGEAETTLRRQATASIQDAVAALRALREAVGRGDRGGIGRALSGLDGPAGEVDELRRVAAGR